jgi:exonuclease SbcC
MEKRAEDLEKELHQLCTEKNFSSLDDVRNLLELELDVEAEQDEINLFRTRLASCREQVEKLSAEAAGKQYHPEAHRAMLQTLEEARQASEDSHKNLVLAQKHLQGLSEKRQQSRDLQQALEKQQRRLDNLNELRNLFRGSGFVRYVSTVYLENLCRSANERFMKLTRNNLSMELNEEGEFIVRDYLNNGKTRLLKTLSGGQTFQAALCLALALAENVKSINRAEQSFFFLDEGFGALDREALRVVFETLKSLRKERRIVGIISHVEELQQEIDVFLRVENDKERGSLISCSWE